MYLAPGFRRRVKQSCMLRKFERSASDRSKSANARQILSAAAHTSGFSLRLIRPTKWLARRRGM